MQRAQAKKKEKIPSTFSLVEQQVNIILDGASSAHQSLETWSCRQTARHWFRTRMDDVLRKRYTLSRLELCVVIRAEAQFLFDVCKITASHAKDGVMQSEMFVGGHCVQPVRPAHGGHVERLKPGLRRRVGISMVNMSRTFLATRSAKIPPRHWSKTSSMSTRGRSFQNVLSQT